MISSYRSGFGGCASTGALILGLLLFSRTVAPAEWTITEKLYGFVGDDVQELHAGYEAVVGRRSLQLGGRLHGRVNSEYKDEEEWGAFGMLIWDETDSAVQVGAGYQQKAPETGTSPAFELRLIPRQSELSRTIFYAQYEEDGAGLGGGFRLEWMSEIGDRVDVEFLLDASWFEELDEDIDGFGAVLYEPSRTYRMIHIGPAIWLDSDRTALGGMISIRP